MFSFEKKICPPDSLAGRAAALPRPLVMTNGVFDLLHRGHVSYLAQARALGAALVVVINSDASVIRLHKGPQRPLNSLGDRAALLAALESISLVSWFDEDDACAPMISVRPDVYVKGGDYDIGRTPEGRVAMQCGARIHALAFVHGYSTSEMIQRIRRPGAL